jgi:hypothetical protein
MGGEHNSVKYKAAEDDKDVSENSCLGVFTIFLLKKDSEVTSISHHTRPSRHNNNMGLIKFNSADGFIDIFYPLLLKLSLKQD